MRRLFGVRVSLRLRHDLLLEIGVNDRCRERNSADSVFPPRIGVPLAPRKFSLETESATRIAGSSQTLARTGQERKTPGSQSLDAGRYRDRGE